MRQHLNWTYSRRWVSVCDPAVTQLRKEYLYAARNLGGDHFGLYVQG